MKQRTYSIRRIFILISVLLLSILTASVMSFLSYAADVSQNRICSAARSTLGACQDFLETEIEKMTDTIHYIYTDNYEYQVLSRNSGAYEGRLIQENSLRRLIEERVPAAGAIFLFDPDERVSIYKFGRAYTAEDFLENVAVKERFYRYCAGLTWKEMGSWQLYRDAVSETPYLARVYQKNDLYVGCLLDLRRVFSVGDTEAFRLSFLWNGEALTGQETSGELLAGQNEMSEKAVPRSLTETVRIAETPVELAVMTDAALVRIRRRQVHITFHPRYITLAHQIPKEILLVGLPGFLMTLMSFFSNTMLNQLVSGYSNEAVAGMGIAKKVDMIGFAVAQGMTQGMLPLIGYNYAAGNKKRVGETMKTTILYSVGIVAIGSVTLFVFASPISGLFIRDQETIAYSRMFIRTLCLSLPLSSVIMTVITVFQATGKKVQPTILSLLRKGGLDVPFMLAFNGIAQVRGIAWATPVADVMALTVSLLLFVPYWRRVARE